MSYISYVLLLKVFKIKITKAVLQPFSGTGVAIYCALTTKTVILVVSFQFLFQLFAASPGRREEHFGIR
jgi:hypothetical protein